MGLTQSQRAILEKARALGGGELGIGLTNEQCAYLLAQVARDLGLLAELDIRDLAFPEFFAVKRPKGLSLAGLAPESLFESIVSRNPDADTYFACLAALQKSRLKYERILETQPAPTMDAVGPRALLQFGTMGADTLAGFLLWRKWFYDIDNRAGQETGYLFEPIISHAVGGVSASSKKSPVRRQDDPGKGRQVDCIRGGIAYEIKLRVTIAASGQGRWREELTFPQDCRASGFKPVLVVLDATPNYKLTELSAAFLSEGGEVYIGSQAWEHLESASGPTMARFIEKYVRAPLQQVFDSCPEAMPSFAASMDSHRIICTIGGEDIRIERL